LVRTILIALIIVSIQLQVFGQDSLSEHLEPLRPFLNKTWKGKVAETPEKEPVYDIARWERILNGRGVRILHSVNDGDYGGETIVVWDAEQESLIFYYFTTAGFYTNGTVKMEDGKMISHEFVTGNQDGITEVKSTTKLTAEGKMEVTTQMLKNGEWTEGRNVLYKETPEAEVVFK